MSSCRSDHCDRVLALSPSSGTHSKHAAIAGLWTFACYSCLNGSSSTPCVAIAAFIYLGFLAAGEEDRATLWYLSSIPFRNIDDPFPQATMIMTLTLTYSVMWSFFQRLNDPCLNAYFGQAVNIPEEASQRSTIDAELGNGIDSLAIRSLWP